MHESSSSRNESMKTKLFKSCMDHSLQFNSESMSVKICECMAQELIDHGLVTDEMREELAIDWNAGINLEDLGNIKFKDVKWMGIGLIIWGNCMKKLYLPGLDS